MARPRQRLRVASWNINSVRLRKGLLPEVVAALAPDVLCLQETKCPDAAFPHAEAEALGFRHRLVRGMKGYNGVAVLSRRPILALPEQPDWCGKGDCRYLGVAVDVPGEPLILHDFYVPAGGDLPDPAANPKFAHKLNFLAEATEWTRRNPPRRAVLLGDLNIAPLPQDVWNHKALLEVVSHTPVETEGLLAWQRAGGFVDAIRHFVPAEEKLFTWWSYRARDWAASDRGRRLDHIWVSADLAGALVGQVVLKAARGWPNPSDHVPVMVELAL